jgi:uncharacterized protein (DUF924 family)
VPPIQADALHAFWFEDTTEPGHDLSAALARWFRATEDFDALIRERFVDSIRRAGAGELDGWCETPRGRLALIVLLDQLSRNAFRGTPEAFAYDAKARSVCREGMARGEERAFVPVEKHFFYLPLLHSEQLTDQDDSVPVFERLRQEAPASQGEYFQAVVDAAHRYHSTITRFGRFPHRNAALGRASTPEELEFMAASTPRWEKGPRAG